MPVTDKIRQNRQTRYDRRQAAAAQVVPEGPYCYSRTGRTVTRNTPMGAVEVPELKSCPYLKIRGDKPRQQNGYCRLLKAGDYTPHPHRTSLLWDAVKECGINDNDPDEQ